MINKGRVVVTAIYPLPETLRCAGKSSTQHFQKRDEDFFIKYYNNTWRENYEEKTQ